MAVEEKYLSDENEIARTEFQLLGILLQFPSKIDEVADVLEVEHFQNPQASLIYEILLNQFQRDSQISKTKLFIKLKKLSNFCFLSLFLKFLTAL